MKSGRKPIEEALKRKQRNFYLNDVEHQKVVEFINSLRAEGKEK